MTLSGLETSLEFEDATDILADAMVDAAARAFVLEVEEALPIVSAADLDAVIRKWLHSNMPDIRRRLAEGHEPVKLW